MSFNQEIKEYELNLDRETHLVLEELHGPEWDYGIMMLSKRVIWYLRATQR